MSILLPLGETAPLSRKENLPRLRILPLGDSITKGSGSSDLNGYRKPLRDHVVSYMSDSDGVDMVGSLRDGNMTDNSHEGHSGEYLAEINTYWQLSIDARPNVVLIHAGTNNMDKEVDLDKAPAIMTDMIVNIGKEAPEATILVAPVIWANDTRMQANTDKFNTQLHDIIEERQQAGQHVIEVPIDIGIDDLSDKKHPNDIGYKKMATAWFGGIKEAYKRGWLVRAIKLSPSDVPGVGLGTSAA